jgi:hypothetical protein
MCTHPIDLMNIHLLCCVHGNKHPWTHDAICDTFVAIVRGDGVSLYLLIELHDLGNSSNFDL